MLLTFSTGRPVTETTFFPFSRSAATSPASRVPPVDDRHAGCNHFDFIQEMRREENGLVLVACEMADEIADFFHPLRIQTACRFIQNDKFRIRKKVPARSQAAVFMPWE